MTYEGNNTINLGNVDSNLQTKTNILVGTPYDDTGGTNKGAIYITEARQVTSAYLGNGSVVARGATPIKISAQDILSPTDFASVEKFGNKVYTLEETDEFIKVAVLDGANNIYRLTFNKANNFEVTLDASLLAGGNNSVEFTLETHSGVSSEHTFTLNKDITAPVISIRKVTVANTEKFELSAKDIQAVTFEISAHATATDYDKDTDGVLTTIATDCSSKTYTSLTATNGKFLTTDLTEVCVKATDASGNISYSHTDLVVAVTLDVNGDDSVNKYNAQLNVTMDLTFQETNTNL